MLRILLLRSFRNLNVVWLIGNANMNTENENKCYSEFKYNKLSDCFRFETEPFLDWSVVWQILTQTSSGGWQWIDVEYETDRLKQMPMEALGKITYSLSLCH